MRLKIVQAGEPVLRQTTRLLTPQEVVSDDIQRLIRDMQETMLDAPGVGLAAPQSGLPLQLAVMEDREELLRALPPEEIAEKERRPVPFQVIVNPRITHSGDDKCDFYEGCLSLGGFLAVVPRSRTVRVEYLDEKGEPCEVEASRRRVVAKLHLPSPPYAGGGRKLQVNESILTKAALNGEDRLENVRIVSGLPGGLNEQTITRLSLNLSPPQL